MRKGLMASTVLVLSIGGVQAAFAEECPERIKAFQQRYDEAVIGSNGQALTDEEKAGLTNITGVAQELYDAGDQSACLRVISRADVLLESAVAPQVVDVDSLEDWPVTNAQGEDLGEVEDVLVDPLTGRIAYLVVEHGGFLGMGEDVFAIPWGLARYASDKEEILLNIPQAKLENAPRFDRSDRSPLRERSWAIAVHSYYDVRPYWEDQPGTSTISQAIAARPGSGEASATIAEDGTEMAATAGTAEEPGEQETSAELKKEIETLQQRIAEQEEQLQEVRKAKPGDQQAAAYNEKVLTHLQQMTTQLAAIGTQLEQVSADLGRTSDQAQPGAAKETGQQASAKTASASSGQQATGGQSTEGKQPEAGNDAQASATGSSEKAASAGSAGAESGKDCSGQIADLKKRVESGLKDNPSSTALMSAEQQLKVLEARMEQDQGADCAARLKTIGNIVEKGEG